MRWRALWALLLCGLWAPWEAWAEPDAGGVAPTSTVAAPKARAPLRPKRARPEPAAPDGGPAALAGPRGPAAPDAAPAPEPEVELEDEVEPEPEPPPRRRRPRKARPAAPPPPEPAPPRDAGLGAAPAAPPPSSPGPTGATPSSGWTIWDVGPPTQPEGPSTLDRIFERLDAALWPVVQVLVLVFVFLRLLSWAVRGLAKRGRATFVLLRRGWVFVEGSVWLATISWAVFQLSARESPSATLLALVAFAVLVALSWNGLRDVAAGLMLAAERPFGLGDHVSLAEGEGRVRAFRSRVLELEMQDGLRVRVPYRRVLGAAKVRKGGRQTTHAIQLELEVPETMDPQDALRSARELAASSPWAVLGEAPRLELFEARGAARVRLVAFAFDAEAESLLHADLLSGWREAARRASEGRGPRA